jgi:predicted DNA-binding transcriptional regulator AlpA
MTPYTQMNRKYKRWTIEEKELAAHLLSQYTIKQVSKKMKRTIGSIKELASNELKDSYCRSRKFREDEGLLQSNVAKKLGVTRSHINNWIKNNNLEAKKCGKKGFYVIEEESLFNWLRDGYLMLPIIFPNDVDIKHWICKQRAIYLSVYVSAIYVMNVCHVSRGALDNWIREFNFPKPIKKIGKLGVFFDRKAVYEWSKNNSQFVNPKNVVKLNSYDMEHDFLNNRMYCKCNT